VSERRALRWPTNARESQAFPSGHPQRARPARVNVERARVLYVAGQGERLSIGWRGHVSALAGQVGWILGAEYPTVLPSGPSIAHAKGLHTPPNSLPSRHASPGPTRNRVPSTGKGSTERRAYVAGRARGAPVRARMGRGSVRRGPCGGRWGPGALLGDPSKGMRENELVSVRIRGFGRDPFASACARMGHCRRGALRDSGPRIIPRGSRLEQSGENVERPAETSRVSGEYPGEANIPRRRRSWSELADVVSRARTGGPRGALSGLKSTRRSRDNRGVTRRLTHPHCNRSLSVIPLVLPRESERDENAGGTWSLDSRTIGVLAVTWWALGILRRSVIPALALTFSEPRAVLAAWVALSSPRTTTPDGSLSSARSGASRRLLASCTCRPERCTTGYRARRRRTNCRAWPSMGGRPGADSRARFLNRLRSLRIFVIGR
jgi:hypothetical protein